MKYNNFMDKNKMIQTIKESAISDGLKQELIEMVESEKSLSRDII